MQDLLTLNGQIVTVILQAFGLGLLAGLVFFFVFWGARLALSVIRG